VVRAARNRRGGGRQLLGGRGLHVRRVRRVAGVARRVRLPRGGPELRRWRLLPLTAAAGLWACESCELAEAGARMVARRAVGRRSVQQGLFPNQLTPTGPRHRNAQQTPSGGGPCLHCRGEFHATLCGYPSTGPTTSRTHGVQPMQVVQPGAQPHRSCQLHEPTWRAKLGQKALTGEVDIFSCLTNVRALWHPDSGCHKARGLCAPPIVWPSLIVAPNHGSCAQLDQ
jgi:hypothetical protein